MESKLPHLSAHPPSDVALPEAGHGVNVTDCLRDSRTVLMEAALAERLKREHGLAPDVDVELASLVYELAGRRALRLLWSLYAQIASDNQLPMLATTPTRRANHERVQKSGFDERIIGDNVAFLLGDRESS